MIGRITAVRRTIAARERTSLPTGAVVRTKFACVCCTSFPSSIVSMHTGLLYLRLPLLLQNVRFQLSPEPEPDSRQKRIMKENKRSVPFISPATIQNCAHFFLLKCFSYLFLLLIFACPIALAEVTLAQQAHKAYSQTISSVRKMRCTCGRTPHSQVEYQTTEKYKRWWKEISSSLKCDFFYDFTIYSFVGCFAFSILISSIPAIDDTAARRDRSSLKLLTMRTRARRVFYLHEHFIRL